MQSTIWSANGDAPATRPRRAGENGHSDGSGPTTPPKEQWLDVAPAVRARLASLLSADFIAAQRRAVSYEVHNPWTIVPQNQTAEWLLSNRSKHCRVASHSDGDVRAAFG
jgi:hypothetical protein